MTQKTALITGVTGQDGAYLAELLLGKGYQVHGIKRRASSFNTERVDHLYRDKNDDREGLRLHYGDMTDSLCLLRLIEAVQPDEVYNLAAQSHVAVSFEKPEYTANADAMGPLRILEAIRTLGLKDKTRFYQASTSELYGGVYKTAQNEDTPFHPRSPYAVAKLYGHWITVNYREAYGLYACSGILFNHESPRRGETFVTRKITRGLARRCHGLEGVLRLGNLDARRDWGHARDYVEAQWLMLQQQVARDYVIATGQQHSVRDFVVIAAKELGITVEFSGTHEAEVGHVAKMDREWSGLKVGDLLVQVDPAYYRPAEVDTLLGDATRARQDLGWSPRTSFAALVSEMVAADLWLAEREHQYGTHRYHGPTQPAPKDP